MRRLLLIGTPILLMIAIALLLFSRAASLEAELRPGALDATNPHELVLWRHRGPDQSTGYAGVEIDLRWSAKAGLRVSHDPLGPNDAAPTLRAVLAQLPTAMSVWLDFKQLDVATADATAPELAAILREGDRVDRCYIEARDLDALAKLRRDIPGLRVIAHVTPWQRLRPLPGYLTLLTRLIELEIDHVALPRHALSDDTALRLAPLILMVYTVNDAEEVERLRRLGVEVVLTDRLPPGGSGMDPPSIEQSGQPPPL